MKGRAEEAIKNGDLDQALTELQGAVRDDPADPALRIFLFQLLCVNGDWNRALTQLNVVADMEAEALLMAQTYRELLQIENYREAVFSGEKSPLIFGDPPEWIGELLQALPLAHQGDGEAARKIVDAAFERATARPGRINDAPFEWISDADMRLGPVLEAIVNGKYYWVPFDNIASLTLSAPEDLRDLVWQPAEFTWATEGKSPGFVPARYPVGGATIDPDCALGRKTEWNDIGSEFFVGVGQKLLTTDVEDYPQLTTTTLTFESPENSETDG